MMRSLVVGLTLMAATSLAAQPVDDAATSEPLRLDAILATPVAGDDLATTDGLTLRSILAAPAPEPEPEPEIEPTPRLRETRLAQPLHWATADPLGRLPFRAPPAEWFRAPRAVAEQMAADRERPDPMRELLRVHDGELPPIRPRGYVDPDAEQRTRRSSAAFFRLAAQRSRADSPPARIRIDNATREIPMRVVIEPLAPPDRSGGQPVAPPGPPLVILLQPGMSESLALEPGYYRVQRHAWSIREVKDGRARRLVVESFPEQRLEPGGIYRAGLESGDEGAIRRQLAN